MPHAKIGVLALAALLSACGGGDAADPAATAQPAAVRARALAVAAAAVSPAEEARQLFEFAEAHPVYGPTFFNSHPQTQTFAPFLYRYYPATGVYLGVASSNDLYYPDGVYVMGGPFGAAPIRVGAVTDFITPTGGGDPTGPNNGCYDLALTEAAGTRTVVDYVLSGASTGNQTFDTLVGNLTTFAGRQAREIETKITGTVTTAEGTGELEIQSKSYQRRTGDAELTHFGDSETTSIKSSGFEILRTVGTRTLSPPFVDKQYALAIGQSYTSTQTGSSTTTTTFFGQPPVERTEDFSTPSTIRYVGREPVTVPAGTYTTCKFETMTGSTVDSTTWIIVGRGIAAQTVSSEATLKATSIRVNGQLVQN